MSNKIFRFGDRVIGEGSWSTRVYCGYLESSNEWFGRWAVVIDEDGKSHMVNIDTLRHEFRPGDRVRGTFAGHRVVGVIVELSEKFAVIKESHAWVDYICTLARDSLEFA